MHSDHMSVWLRSVPLQQCTFASPWQARRSSAPSVKTPSWQTRKGHGCHARTASTVNACKITEKPKIVPWQICSAQSAKQFHAQDPRMVLLQREIRLQRPRFQMQRKDMLQRVQMHRLQWPRMVMLQRVQMQRKDMRLQLQFHRIKGLTERLSPGHSSQQHMTRRQCFAKGVAIGVSLLLAAS